MHEMSIAQSLIDIVRDEMGKHGVTVLKSVRIQVGQLSAIVPDSLSFCFNIMTSGTDLEGSGTGDGSHSAPWGMQDL